MQINVSDLRQLVGDSRQLEVEVRDASWLEKEGQAEISGPVTGQLTICNMGHFLLAKGLLCAPLRLVCSRCLEDFAVHQSFPYEERFCRPAELRLLPVIEQEAVQLYEGDFLDLSETVMQAVLLFLPLKAVCREDCKGLCPRCGANLNVGPCSCNEKAVDVRWARLKELLD